MLRGDESEEEGRGGEGERGWKKRMRRRRE